MKIDLTGCCILIVEDEPLIALELTSALECAHATVITATTLQEALRLAEEPTLSGAVLDLALSRDNALSLCKRLAERGVPFVIYSGYPEIPAECKPSAVVSKPAAGATIVHAVADMLRR